MGRRKPITEDDILLTELLIARSFGNLKQSIAREATRTVSSIGGSVKKHPYAIAGTALGAGIILYGLFRLLHRGSSSAMKGAGNREQSSRTRMGMEIFSMIMPLVTPYISAYVGKSLGKMFARNR